MTKFDELMDIITRNKNKDKKLAVEHESASIAEDDKDDFQLEVSGNESTRDPLVASATEDLDPDIIDMLYRSARNRVPRGEGASSWDSDY